MSEESGPRPHYHMTVEVTGLTPPSWCTDDLAFVTEQVTAALASPRFQRVIVSSPQLRTKVCEGRRRIDREETRD